MQRIRTVGTSKSRPVPLAAWLAEFTLPFSRLHDAGQVAWLKASATLRRQGGYRGFDLLIFGLAYFVALPGGGFKGFWDVTSPCPAQPSTSTVAHGPLLAPPDCTQGLPGPLTYMALPSRSSAIRP